MTRGCLTNKLKEKYNITLKQLRLLPYFQYLLMNESRLDARKIDAEERAILQQWQDEGKITFSISEPCTCTKEFWDWMNEVLWESYVLHKESEKNDDCLNKDQRRKLRLMIAKLSHVLTQNDYHDIIMIFDKAIDRRIEEIKHTIERE